MSKRLVLAGGGHAHMMILANIGTIIADGHEVCVIQPSDHHYYSGMGPGMLSTVYSADEIRFNTRFVVERQGGRFVRAKVASIEAEKKVVLTDSGESIPYDVLSCNAGSFVPFSKIEGSRENIFSAKPIERLLEAQQRILTLAGSGSVSIAVIGGGPAAVEISGNSHHLALTTGCTKVEIRLFAGNKMMAGYSDTIREIIRKSLQSRDIIIDESGYVDKIADGTIYQENGTTFTPDIIFLATGVKPSPIFSTSGLAVGPDGGLLVNKYLQSTDFPDIFGGGDCIYFSPQPLDKVGVYAVRENPILLHNVRAKLSDEELRPFEPGGGYLLIFNLGEKTGALQKGPIRFGGKLAFLIKDYIDKKFMQKFQALEK